MRNYLNAIFFFILLSGCSEPKTGDIYEDLLTRERSTIADIKTGKQLIASFDNIIRSQMNNPQRDENMLQIYKLKKATISESELYVYLRKSNEGYTDIYDINMYLPYFVINSSSRYKKIN